MAQITALSPTGVMGPKYTFSAKSAFAPTPAEILWPAILLGLQSQLMSNITGLVAYDYPPDSIANFPAAVVIPETLDPRLCIGGNSYTARVRVVMLTASGDDARGFRDMYRYLAPTGANISFKAALAVDRTLGAKCDDCQVVAYENVGRRLVGGDTGPSYYGFDALVDIIKSRT